MATESSLMSFAGRFVSDVVSGLERGPSQWTSKRESDQKSAAGSPASDPPDKRKKTSEAALAQQEMEADMRSLTTGLVTHMLSAGMAAGGEFIEAENAKRDARIDVLETSVADGNQRISVLENSKDAQQTQIDDLAAKLSACQLEVQRVKEEVHVQGAWQPPSAAAPSVLPASGSPPSGNANPVRANRLVYELPVPSIILTPPSERKEAIIGNLGWNTDKDSLLARCEAVLREAKVDPHSYNEPCCQRTSGSQASVVFKSPQERKTAQQRVGNLKKLFPEVAVHPRTNHERPHVFVAPEKKSHEMLSGHILRELNKAIEDLESRLEQSARDGWYIVGGPLFSEWKLCKDDQRHTLVTVTARQIRWTTFADKRYSNLEDLDLISEWAYSRASRRS